MRTLVRLVLLAVLLSSCSSLSPEPTPTAEPAPPFAFVSQDPVIASGAAQHWTGKWMNPGATIYADGQFHMFLNAFHEWPGEVSVGHFVSENGYTWEAAQAEPVFTSADIGYVQAGQGADVSSVVIADDGTWLFYFHVVTQGGGDSIGLATAPGPDGPWDFGSGPVLKPGAEGAWDAGRLEWPCVVRDGSTYRMYYTGTNAAGRKAIGMATSADGLTWTKYNDPTTEEAQFAESDPVLRSTGGWEGSSTDRPRVAEAPDGWVMIYNGLSTNTRGLAYSEDGVTWRKSEANPIITRADYAGMGSDSWDTSLLYFEGVYYYYMEIGSLENTQIYLAQGVGPLELPSED